MTTELLNRRLTTSRLYDLSFNSVSTSDNGWKISIQGKCVSHSIELFEMLNEYLYANDVPFKIATENRFSMINEYPQQALKAMTIYCPDGFDFNELCEAVYSRTIEYKGWYNISTPNGYSHYAGGLFTRNDRDLNGSYVPASNIN